MIGAIILAGGNGTRFKEKKQFCTFRGKVLWKHVYDKVKMFISEDNIVVVGVDIPGGETRSKSVINGLKYFKNKKLKKIIILEAARPMVKEEQIMTLINLNSESASFSRPIVNTIINKDGSYVNRNDYYDLLTPQCFDYEKLLYAYENGDFVDMTDETRVMYEFYGLKAKLIDGDDYLFKVTYPHDLLVLESLIKGE